MRYYSITPKNSLENNLDLNIIKNQNIKRNMFRVSISNILIFNQKIFLFTLA
jgi:hypothetical protein